MHTCTPPVTRRPLLAHWGVRRTSSGSLLRMESGGRQILQPSRRDTGCTQRAQRGIAWKSGLELRLEASWSDDQTGSRRALLLHFLNFFLLWFLFKLFLHFLTAAARRPVGPGMVDATIGVDGVEEAGWTRRSAPLDR